MQQIPKPRFYSAHADTSVTYANLPHWEQESRTCFLTFRLADSLPEDLLSQLAAEREEWELVHPKPWSDADTQEHFSLFEGKIHEWLDQGHGRCILRSEKTRALVEDVLRHFDGTRYVLYSYVIMPNHVHVLFMPMPGFSQSKIIQSWKGVSAHWLNRLLSETGAVWQKEYWDTLVRNERHFRAVLRYIRKNDPIHAWSVYEN